jgi:hypothetical protein
VPGARPLIKPGDVVRSRSEPGIGLVFSIVDSGYDAPCWELHVNWVTAAGEREGVGIFDSESVLVSNDKQSIAEARFVGLLGPVGDPRWHDHA